jgi:hypothetical protein
MKTPFLAAANKVLSMYERRQLVATAKAPAHSESEIYWACEKLRDIAGAAAYAGSGEAVKLSAAAELWSKTHKFPEPFTVIFDEAE